jgi:hypothetical protein
VAQHNQVGAVNWRGVHARFPGCQFLILFVSLDKSMLGNAVDGFQ